MKLIKITSTLSQTWMDTFDERVEIICQGTDEDIKNAIEGIIKDEYERYDDCMSWVVMDYLREQRKTPVPDGAEYKKRRREALNEFEKAQQEIQRLKKLRKELVEEKNLENVDPYFHYQGWSEQFYKYEIVG